MTRGQDHGSFSGDERRELAERLEFFELLVEHMVDVIVMTDEQYRNIYVSPSIEQLLGHTPREFLAADPSLHMTPKSLDRLKAGIAWRAQRDGGKGAEPLPPRLLELDLLHKDGRVVHTEVTARPLHSPQGEFLGLINVIRDVSDRKRAEERFRAQYLGLPLPTYTWRVDRGGIRLLDLNTAAVAYSGNLLADSGSVDIRSFAPDAPDLGPDLSRCHAERRTLLKDVSFQTPEGETRHVKLHFIPIPPDCVMLHLEDMTEARRMESEVQVRLLQFQEADKMAALGILSAGVAHEVHNPNSWIMLNAPVIRDAWADILPILDEHRRREGDFQVARLSYDLMRDRLPELARGIMVAAERIRIIVKRMKEYARQDARPAMDQRVDLNEVLHAALVLLQSHIKRSTRCFETREAPGPLLARGNFQRLEQVVVNCLLNACQGLESPDQAILVETGLEDGKIVLRIQDQGPGMTPESLRRAKDPFYTTRREQGGLGLGLTIAQTIVQDHQGELNVTSDSGAGFTAVIRLPAIEDEAGPAEAAPAENTP